MTTTCERIESVPKASASGVRRWSTYDVPQAHALDYWLGAVCEGLGEMEVSSAMVAGFSASLESAECGPVVVNRIEGTPQDVYRRKSGIARSDTSCFHLRSALKGPWASGQAHGPSRLLPGDCMLFDSRRPYEMHFSEPNDLITLRLPVPWVESWLTDPIAQCGLRIDASTGWGQPLASFVRQLTPHVAAGPPLPARLMTDQLGALLALATDDFAVRDARHASTIDAVVRRATERVQERYAEFGLTAQAIAQDLYISERTLHRYFARMGTTFLQYLVKQRMMVADRMLRDSRFDRLTVSEIGRRVGLADSSHFIRQCRKSLGATPAELRRVRRTAQSDDPFA